MAEDNQEERVKRYLQWATVLVLVAVAVTAIDLQIKQGILRAVKEASELGSQTVTSGSGPAHVVIGNKPVDQPAGNTANGFPDANVRVDRTIPSTDSLPHESPSDELRIDSGQSDG